MVVCFRHSFVSVASFWTNVMLFECYWLYYWKYLREQKMIKINKLFQTLAFKFIKIMFPTENTRSHSVNYYLITYVHTTTSLLILLYGLQHFVTFQLAVAQKDKTVLCQSESWWFILSSPHDWTSSCQQSVYWCVNVTSSLKSLFCLKRR